MSETTASLDPLDAYSNADLVEALRRRSRGVFLVSLPLNQPTNGSVNLWNRCHFVDGASGMTLMGAIQIELQRLTAAFNLAASPNAPPPDDRG